MNHDKMLRLFCMLMLLCGFILSVTTNMRIFSAILTVCGMAGMLLFSVWQPAQMREHIRHGGADGMRNAVNRPDCRFSDVAANAEAKRSLAELADYLRNPEKYARYGARMPRGVLLYGPPGTGKTLLARALAGEAEVPFYALSGSDFVQMYVGVGASRIREVFKRARKAGKCVIFVDEIDALGKRRDGQSSDERDQTLNALLSEMSGFHASDGILVLAATNRPDTLDPALLRPGRFDRQIEVGLPGRAERLSILKLHSRNKPLADDVDLDMLAAETTQFSGASLESLLNEAAISAAGRADDRIHAQDVRDAFFRSVAGADRTVSANPREKLSIALHEAGHAVAIRLLMPENRLARVSILPSGHGAAGYNLSIPPERLLLCRDDLENQVQALLAGRAAEYLIGGEEALSSGASGDLARAAELVAAMVMEFGMGGEPAVSLRTLGQVCGSAGSGADVCKHMLSELFERVLQLLDGHRQVLIRLAETLVLRESLSGAEVDAVLHGVSKESPDSTKAV